MKKPVIILGAGGHARVLLETLSALGVSVPAIADVSPTSGPGWGAIPIILESDLVSKFSFKSVLLANGVGSVSSMAARRVVFERHKLQGFTFADIIHPFSYVAGSARLGEGIQVMAGAVIQAGAVVEANTIVNTRASVDHDCHVGAHSHLAPGVTLSGGVRVGNEVHIGTGASLIQGVVVGDRAFIAAGAVVTKDVEPGERVAGVPARKLKA